MRRFFIEQSDVTSTSPSINGPDAKHIKNVLRLKPGDRIELFDGAGFEYEAQIEAFPGNAVAVSVLDKYGSKSESPVYITVALGFLKDRKMDDIVRQLTELGITKWFPFLGERSVARPDRKRLAARKERWEKIAKESLKQCKRGCIPEIGDTVSFERALKMGEGCDLKIVFWEEETCPLNILLTDSPGGIKTIFLMLGSEGGFSIQEIEKAKDHGFGIASLGPRILKADTAPIAACSIIQHSFGDLGNKKS